jgi:hypothetical protein
MVRWLPILVLLVLPGCEWYGVASSHTQQVEWANGREVCTELWGVSTARWAGCWLDVLPPAALPQHPYVPPTHGAIPGQTW